MEDTKVYEHVGRLYMANVVRDEEIRRLQTAVQEFQKEREALVSPEPSPAPVPEVKNVRSRPN